MVFNKNVSLSQIEGFENDVLKRVSDLPLLILLKAEILKRKWNYELVVSRTEDNFKKYYSYLVINIFDENNISISESDEPNCTLMLCETICFFSRGRIVGIDLAADQEFLESLEMLVNQVRKYV